MARTSAASSASSAKRKLQFDDPPPVWDGDHCAGSSHPAGNFHGSVERGGEKLRAESAAATELNKELQEAGASEEEAAADGPEEVVQRRVQARKPLPA